MMRVRRIAFRDLGYTEGKNLVLDVAFADGDLDRMPVTRTPSPMRDWVHFRITGLSGIGAPPVLATNS